MLKAILLVTAVSIFHGASARQDTLYCNNAWAKVDKEAATYFRIVSKEHHLYKVDDYHVNGIIYRMGYRTSMESEEYKYRTGHYVLYDKEGYKTEDGDYDNGKRIGLWKSYYKHSEAIYTEQHFEQGELTGHYLTYDSGAHKVIRDVEYVSRRLLKTTRYTGGDTLVTIDKFFGPQHERDELYKNGKLRKKDLYNGSALTSSECYTEQARPMECPVAGTQNVGNVFQFVEEMPISKYDLSEYLANSLHYPAEAREHNIYGRVIVKFVVDEDGTTSNVTIVHGIGGGCDEEAARVVSEMPAWRPGMQNGIPVRVYFTLPIVFRLK